MHFFISINADRDRVDDGILERTTASCQLPLAANRCVGVILDLVVLCLVDVDQFELSLVAVAAQNLIIEFLLGLFGLPPDAQTADVVVATARNQHMVEVPQADRTVVLELVPQFLGFGRVLCRVGIDALDFLFLEDSVDPDLVPLLHGLGIGLVNFSENTSLVVDVLRIVVT